MAQDDRSHAQDDRSRAVAGLRAAALGSGLGLAVLLLGWGVMALIGDNAFPSGLLGVAIVPVGTTLSALWGRRSVNRRPALLVALLLFLLLLVLAAALRDGFAADPDVAAGPGWLLLGYFPGALLAGAAFGALIGEPVGEPGRHWLRFAGRSRRFHLAVYGGLAALLALTAAVAVAGG